MEEKSNSETLSEIYRNTQLALDSISDILPEVEDSAVHDEILHQHEEYEKISSKAALLAREYRQELKEPNLMKKAMMWSSIKMNTLTDNSRPHIAQMMLQGTVMGLSSLKTTQTESEGKLDEPVSALLGELIGLEEQFEDRWKAFL